jgi:hypothetical protein
MTPFSKSHLSPAGNELNHAFYDDSAARLAARIENMRAASDPVPAPRSKTTFPGTLLAVIVLGFIAVLTVGNWLNARMTVLNDLIVKGFLVLIPLLLLAGIYFLVRFAGFWSANRAAEEEAVAEAEAELMQREARFAAGRSKGDRRLCIHPVNPAKGAAKRRRRADKLRTV